MRAVLFERSYRQEYRRVGLAHPLTVLHPAHTIHMYFGHG
jgi:hypothetical protein